MALDDIISKIDKEADQQSSNIINEANSNAREIINNAKKAAEKIDERARTRANRIRESIEKAGEADIGAKVNEIIQRATKNAFDLSMLNLMSAADEFKKDKMYEKLIVKLLSEAKEKLGEDIIVYMDKDDTIRFKGLGQNIKVSKKPMDGGFYAQSSDGKKIIDMSMERIIESIRDKIGEKIIERLKV